MMGVYLQRSWIVLSVTAFILLPLFIFTTPILIFLGQDETISQVAGTVGYWSIPILFAFIASFTCQTFLQSQSKNTIIAFLAAFSIAVHILLSWLFTMKFNLGISGAMLSTILAFWIPNIGQIIFITCGWCSNTWKGFSFWLLKIFGLLSNSPFHQVPCYGELFFHINFFFSLMDIHRQCKIALHDHPIRNHPFALSYK
jgi:MATE family multidrug resistance protein